MGVSTSSEPWNKKELSYWLFLYRHPQAPGSDVPTPLTKLFHEKTKIYTISHMVVAHNFIVVLLLLEPMMAGLGGGFMRVDLSPFHSFPCSRNW